MEQTKLTGYPSIHKDAVKIMTEYEKMKSGQWFNPSDKSFLWSLIRSEFLQRRFNRSAPWNLVYRDFLLKRLFGSTDGKLYSCFSPLRVVFGRNIHVGKNVFINCNCYFQDYADITLGDDVMIGPNVSIVTIKHPMLIEERKVMKIDHSIISGSRGNYERAFPVTIGRGVAVYPNTFIFPGVTIGDNSVIGASSVVTHDIPANVFAYGAPCRVIRPITEEDKAKDNFPV